MMHHEYLNAGLCVLPAIRKGSSKQVALSKWKPYQTRLPTHTELDGWNFQSVCIVCGKVSGNLEMIDFDLGGQDFEQWRAKIDPGLFARLVVETTPSGGYHVVYRCTEPVSGNLKLKTRTFKSDEPLVIGGKEYQSHKGTIKITSIETRGEGGLFLCAPSEGYTIIQGELTEVPTITAKERDTLLGAAWDENPVGNLSAIPFVAESPSTRPGDEYNERGDMREVLARHGWTLVQPGENERWRRPGKSEGTSATLKDRVFYCFSSNASPFEPDQGYSPFAVYAMLEHSGDFKAAAHALRSHAEPFVADLPDDDMPNDVTDLIDARPRMRKPVIHGLLREGETMNVIAPPKRGKSWLVLDLAMAVATGREWLGRYPTEQGKVLVIDNELHEETSAHRIPIVAEARKISLREIGRTIQVHNLRGKLRDLYAMEAYFERFNPGTYKVVILDAFYRFMPIGGDENDNATMANIYNLIDRMADRLKCCFVLIHHTSKGNQAGKAVTDIGAGAGSQARATDTHLVLRSHEQKDVVVLDAAVRSWQPIEPVCLRWEFPVWTVDESIDPDGIETARPARPKAITPEEFANAMLNGVPQTKLELQARAKAELGISRQTMRELLCLAESRGLVAMVEEAACDKFPRKVIKYLSV